MMITKEQDDLFENILNGRMSKPTTVMCLGKPTIIKDPVRFRKDLQALVMSTMNLRLLSDKQREEVFKKGTMIEVATLAQLERAVNGDLDSFKYLMDRVLGKPVNQTNSVSMNITYEQFVDKLDPDEHIKPVDVINEYDVDNNI